MPRCKTGTMPKEDKEMKPLEVVKRVKSNLKRYREQFDKNVKEERDAYYGKIWKNTQERRPYENRIFQIVESEVPILTDSLPGTAIRPQDPAFDEQAINLEKAIEWVHEDQKLPLMLPMVVRNSLIEGVGWIHQYYDVNSDDGQGKIKREIVPWDSVWVDDSCQLPED